MAAKSTDSFKNIVVVTFFVCLFCAVMVSIASIVLRPMQIINKQLDQKRNILAVLDADISTKEIIESQFSKLIVKAISFEKGVILDEIDSTTVNVKSQLKQPESFTVLPAKVDIAKIKKLEKLTKVYLRHDSDGKIEKIVLPIRGYGLWSTLYGYISLEKDLNTIAGISFYDHAETPGLGGEIDNKRWKKHWIGKKIYDQDMNVAFKLVKGGIDLNKPSSVHQVDSIAGASLTSRGVENLIGFWFGDSGFKKLLTNLK